MKKRLTLSILAFSMFALLLSSCSVERFDISFLRYFAPSNCKVIRYTIRLAPREVLGVKAKAVKSVRAVYESSNGIFVSIESVQFVSSFAMHEFWHKWAKKEFSLSQALQSEWWWLWGKISSDHMDAWYNTRDVFVVYSESKSLRKQIEKELKIFVKTFAGVKS